LTRIVLPGVKALAILASSTTPDRTEMPSVGWEGQAFFFLVVSGVRRSSKSGGYRSKESDNSRGARKTLRHEEEWRTF